MISQLFSLRLMGAKVHISLQKKECFQPAFRTEPKKGTSNGTSKGGEQKNPLKISGFQIRLAEREGLTVIE